jgi:hypothetical protein
MSRATATATKSAATTAAHPATTAAHPATATAHSAAAATTTATAAAAAGQYVTRHPRTHGQHRHGDHDLFFHFGIPCISRALIIVSVFTESTEPPWSVRWTRRTALLQLLR